MSRSEYPFVRESGKGPMSEPTDCCACDKPATAWVRIAGSYMRGDDEFYSVCDRHRSIANDAPGRFFAHIRTKSRFVSEKVQ